MTRRTRSIHGELHVPGFHFGLLLVVSAMADPSEKRSDTKTFRVTEEVFGRSFSVEQFPGRKKL